MFRPRSILNRQTVAALAGMVACAGLGYVLLTYTMGRPLTHLSFDVLQVAQGDVEAKGVVLVVLDERAHQELQQPFNAPWDRSLHAQLIDRLTRAGAKAVVMDIVFSDPNPADPQADEALARAIDDNTQVVLAADIVPHPDTLAREFIPPFDRLLDVVANVGSAEIYPNHDMVVRQHTPIIPDEPIPTLSWAAAQITGAPVTLRQGADEESRWLRYYGGPNQLPMISYHDALDTTKISDQVFSNKVVFVGARLMTKFSGERKDEFRTPFSRWVDSTRSGQTQFASGVEIQAVAFLNLTRGDWLTRLPRGAEVFLVLVFGTVFGFGLVRLKPLTASLDALAGVALVMVAAFVLLRMKSIWVPWVIPVVQISAALSWGILFNAIQFYVQKRLYEQTLGIYLPPKLVKKFSSDRQLLRPGAKEENLTILFSDIAGFTDLSHQVTSEELASLMNNYFQIAVSECIHATDGTVVKYIGDAIFAFWNAPEPQEDHAWRACEAALRFSKHCRPKALGKELVTRIGIHTGKAHVGNFGSLERVDYTALGESVNLASRLEGLNKFLGTSCVLSEETHEALADRLLTRYLGQFQLKGFDYPVRVHELLGWPEDESTHRDWIDLFEQALTNYRQKDMELARLGFQQVLEARPKDGPARFYLERIEQLAAQPLPKDWDGSTQLVEK